MATGTCFSAIKACRIRLVRLDSCGRPVEGPSSVAVSSGFVSVTASAEIEEGEEFLVKNACGEPCINEKDCDFLKRYNLTIAFCKVDPTVMELTTSNRALTDADGRVIGTAFGSDIQCEDGWSLELWQKVAGADCEPGQEQPWSYWAFPWLTSGIVGDVTFENGPFTFEVTARTKAVGEGTWDATPGDGSESRGPFEVFPEGAGLFKGEHLGQIITTIQPPEDTCGTAPFVRAGGPDAPGGAAATEVTDGTGEVLLTWTDPAVNDPALPTDTSRIRVFLNGPGYSDVEVGSVALGVQELLLGDPATDEVFASGGAYTFTLYSQDGLGNLSDAPATVAYTHP